MAFIDVYFTSLPRETRTTLAGKLTNHVTARCVVLARGVGTFIDINFTGCAGVTTETDTDMSCW